MCDSASQLEIARMVSCGEIISSVRVSNILNKNLIKAISVSIYDINLTYEDGFNVNDKINKYLVDFDVIIIPGFIGLKENEVRLLPRGGSNITASFFAYYFKCDLVIFTDVDGLYYEDPKKNIKAEKIKILSYETLKEITKDNHALFPIEGIKYLEMGNVKVLIRNTEYKYGTVIKKI
jgi:aspartokinase